MTVNVVNFAFGEGFNAFHSSKPCLYEHGSANYADWWHGWQEAAAAYLLTEFEKAASHD